jgi:hypothetical protein
MLLAALASAAVAASTASGGPLAAPMAALREGNCERLGAWVNDRDAGAQSARDAMAAVMFTEGFCVEAQPTRALEFFQKSAAEPDVGAASAIGLRYALGDALPQSYRKAGIWLTQADGVLTRAQNPEARGADFGPPRFDAAQTAAEVWRGYLITLHYVATQILRRDRGSVQTMQPADVSVTLCVKDGRLATTVSGRAEDATRGAARVRAEQDARDAYARAEKILPQTPLAALGPAGPVPCIQRNVNYRLR